MDATVTIERGRHDHKNYMALAVIPTGRTKAITLRLSCFDYAATFGDGSEHDAKAALEFFESLAERINRHDGLTFDNERLHRKIEHGCIDSVCAACDHQIPGASAL